MGQTIAYRAIRDGVAERFADPAVHKNLAVDLTCIGHADDRRRDVEHTLVKAAKHHDANPLYLLHPVPGIDTRLRFVLLHDIDDLNRFPRGQVFASYGRLVKCAKASHGTHAGSFGTKIGHAHLTWALAEAAVLCLRDQPAGPKLLDRWEKKHRKGQALMLLAQPLARAVYGMLQRKVVCDMQTFLHDAGRGIGEPDASRDTQGRNLICTTLDHASIPASLNA